MDSSIKPTPDQALTLQQILISRLMRWRIGIAIVSLIAIARMIGLLEGSELFFLDFFLKYRLKESTDSRITIVGIDEKYINPNGIELPEQEFYLTDQKIVDLISKIFEYEPIVVGLDLFIDKPRSEDELQVGRIELIRLLQEQPNLIGAEKLFEPNPIGPPSELDADIAREKIGFNDFPPDAADGKVRRSYLAVALTNKQQEEIYYESFALKLARLYLAEKNLEIENGDRDENTVRFGKTEIPRLTFGAGGYFREQLDNQVQTLINYRSGSQAFSFILASQLLAEPEKVDQSLLRDRLIIIGNVDYRTARTIETIVARSIFQPAEKTSQTGDRQIDSEAAIIIDRIFGVEIQAHAASQILSAALDFRPLFWALPTLVEYGYIVALGSTGILVGKLFSSTFNGFLFLGFVNTCIFGISYLLLFHVGLWLPVFPALLAISLNGIAYIAFYQSERTWQALVQERDQALSALENERQQTVERAFAAIHSGPLQTLADILRYLRDETMSDRQILMSLENLNFEIRDLGEHLRQEIVNKEDSVLLQGNIKLDLSHPMHELFYEVYKATLESNYKYPGFQTLQIRTVSFDFLPEVYLTLKLKRKLCQFLAETLCNVGKHAIGTTRLNVSGKYKENCYILKISDNGPGLLSTHEGEGTRFCQKLAASLNGNFLRKSMQPNGTLCMLTWTPQYT